MKSALRDWLSVSYGIINITMMSHLLWLSPLWCLTAPPSRPAGKRVTRFSGRFAPLRIVFPCHRGIGRATKEKRLYGQARRLTSPDLHILCRMRTVDNKAPQSNPFTQRIAKNKVPPPGQCYSVKRFTQAYVITTCAFFVSKKSLGLQKNIKTSKKGLTNPQKFEAPPVSKGTTPIVNKEDLL